MAKRIAVTNMKGGVGKSTITVQLAYHLAGYRELDKRVLVVDLDPQGNASQYLLGYAGYMALVRQSAPTIVDVMEARCPVAGWEATVHEVVPWWKPACVDLVPARIELSQSPEKRGFSSQNLDIYLDIADSEYDVVLVDCPPTVTQFTLAAYTACHQVLVPVQPEYLSSVGLPLLYASLEEYRRSTCGSIHVAGVVLNHPSEYRNAPEADVATHEIRARAEEFGWYMFGHTVPHSRSIAKSARCHLPLWGTAHAQPPVKSAFYRFATEFAQRVLG